ncbi:MAG TPA: SBBP repeat-containing protein [Bacteroidia bacterium]|nr:SBBP repeat-containing protein [Bacteroidia bacterium]
MKKNYLLIVAAFTCLIGNANAQSPDWLWAKAIGGTGLDRGLSSAVDASGNVYTTGHFLGTVDFDPGAGTYNLTSAGLEDIFISKLDSSGNFIWAIAMGGTDADRGSSITIDASANVYTTGHFNGTADFDPGAGTFNLASAGLNDIFISKLDASGNFAGAKAMGGTSNDQGNSISIDTSGNVYSTGKFSGTVDFDPGAGTFNLTSAGGQDIFVNKLDASGNFVWAKAMGGGTIDDEGLSIAIDASANVYTTGYFKGPADFDPGAGTYNLNSVVNWYDIFISKLDSSGNFIWAKAMGGGATDFGHSIAIDASQNVYTTGYFYGTADFDPGAGTYNLTSAATIQDIFVSKLDASGNFAWAKAISGTGYDEGYSIAVDASANVYTTGKFTGTSDFDPGAGTFNLTSAGGSDVFISKLDVSGNFVWAKSAGGTDADAGLSLALATSGNILVTGVFRSPSIAFSLTTLTNAGNFDIFIAKLDTLSIPTTNNEIENFGNSILLFPNPAMRTISFNTNGYTGNLHLQVINMLGQKIISENVKLNGEDTYTIDVSNLPQGIYMLILLNDLELNGGSFMKE